MRLHRGTLRDIWARKDIGFVLILAAAGLLVGVAGGTHVLEHNGAVQENQPVEATIESTGVDRKIVDTDDGTDYKYRPVVEYSYSVGGTTYTQDNVFPGSFERWRDSRSWASRIAGEYGPGESVTARYNPRNPAHAYIRNDGWPGEWIVTAGYAVFLVVAGAGLILKGFRRRKQRELIADTPTEEAESLSMGPSEITGVARPTDGGPVSAPFTDEECVVATWRVLEYDEDPGDDDGGWQLIEEGLRTTRFRVDDGTGSVPVEPHPEATYELDEANEQTIAVDAHQTAPPAIQEFFDEVARVDPVDRESSGSGTQDGDREYTQNLIEPGEEVYVFGTVQPGEGGGRSNVDNLVIRKVPEDDPTAEPMFMIADEPEAELVSERRWALWRLPVGIVGIVVGVGLVLGVFGPPVGLRLPVILL